VGMKLSRRKFLKAGAFGVSSVPFLGLFNLLPAPEVFATSVDGDGIVKLFMAECNMYPRGNVAHSVFGVESISPEIRFGVIIRGLSIAVDRRERKYFAFEAYENDFLTDAKFRREFMDDAMMQMALAWKRNKTLWGIAPR